MKKTILISIAAILVAAIALGAVGYMFWDKNKTPDEVIPEVNDEIIVDDEVENEEENQEPENPEGVEEQNIYAVRGIRMLSAPMTVSEETMSQTLTATVIPATAVNKEVDWTVSWANPEGDFEKGHDVSEFVTLSIASDGSTTAEVIAHQAFGGTPIIVTVTTRVGGFKAESVIRYIGIPTAMEIKDNGNIDEHGRYAALAQKSTEFNIDLTNLFDIVTEEYINDFAEFEVISVQAIGSITCSGKQWNAFLNAWMPTNSTKEVQLADIMQGRFNAEIVGSKLVISAGQPIESYAFTDVTDDGGTGLGGQVINYSYASGVETCYFVVTIKDHYTGLTSTANFYISCDTSGVTLNSGTILF